jgi:hypothetical protein
MKILKGMEVKGIIQLLLILIIVSGCSNISHRNYERIKLGMSSKQVGEIMGMKMDNNSRGLSNAEGYSINYRFDSNDRCVAKLFKNKNDVIAEGKFEIFFKLSGTIDHFEFCGFEIINNAKTEFIAKDKSENFMIYPNNSYRIFGTIEKKQYRGGLFDVIIANKVYDDGEILLKQN